MINCQERVSCQLASDLCALCPNHLLRGERSCLSYYNNLYTHLCHGKGELPWRGLLLSLARHCSCLLPICHLCAMQILSCRMIIVNVCSHNFYALQSKYSFQSMSREGIKKKNWHSFYICVLLELIQCTLMQCTKKMQQKGAFTELNWSFFSCHGSVTVAPGFA